MKYGMERLPYWLRGGIIFPILGTIIVLIFRLITMAGVDLDGPFNIYLVVMIATGPGLILIIFVSSLIGCNPFMDVAGSPQYCNSGVLASIVIIASVFISYFVLGAIIGAIYGKIKSKNIS